MRLSRPSAPGGRRGTSFAGHRNFGALGRIRPGERLIEVGPQFADGVAA